MCPGSICEGQAHPVLFRPLDLCSREPKSERQRPAVIAGTRKRMHRVYPPSNAAEQRVQASQRVSPVCKTGPSSLDWMYLSEKVDTGKCCPVGSVWVLFSPHDRGLLPLVTEVFLTSLLESGGLYSVVPPSHPSHSRQSEFHVLV